MVNRRIWILGEKISGFNFVTENWLQTLISCLVTNPRLLRGMYGEGRPEARGQRTDVRSQGAARTELRGLSKAFSCKDMFLETVQ